MKENSRRNKDIREEKESQVLDSKKERKRYVVIALQ